MDVQNGTAHWTASNWTANAGGRAASVAASYWAASSRTAPDWTASYGTVSNWAASDGAVASRTASDWWRRSAEALGGLQRAASSHFANWLWSCHRVRRADEVWEFSILQSAISIGIDTTNNLEQFVLRSIMSTSTEETAEIESVDAAIVVLVNWAVCG